MQMPKLDLELIKTQLTAEEFELVKGIVATRGKNKGCLRAAKPKVKMHVLGTKRIDTQYGSYDKEIIEPDEKQGKTAYIWRMVAFDISPLSQHHCMPCTADFSVPGHWGAEKRAILKDLDRIADIVGKTVPPMQHHGTLRWGRYL